MRTVPMKRIENFIGQYQDNSTLTDPSQPPSLSQELVSPHSIFESTSDLDS